MATNTYTVPAGGDWFDPANWSAGVVPSPGSEPINGGVTSGAGATLAFTSQELEEQATEHPSVALNGQIVVNGGTLLFNSFGITGTSNIQIADAGTVNIQSVTDPNNPDIDVTFAPAGGTFNVRLFFSDSPTISGFGAGDTVQGWVDNAGTLQETYADNILTVRDLRGARMAQPRPSTLRQWCGSDIAVNSTPRQCACARRHAAEQRRPDTSSFRPTTHSASTACWSRPGSW